MDENNKVMKDGTEHDEGEHDEEIDEEHERRRRRHMRSCSQGYAPESMQKELKEVRDLI